MQEITQRTNHSNALSNTMAVFFAIAVAVTIMCVTVYLHVTPISKALLSDPPQVQFPATTNFHTRPDVASEILSNITNPVWLGVMSVIEADGGVAWCETMLGWSECPETTGGLL